MTTEVTDLVLTCLRMATWRRGHAGHPVGVGLIHDSDVGSQHTSLCLAEHLALKGLALSTGFVSAGHDNGLMKSVMGLYEAG